MTPIIVCGGLRGGEGTRGLRQSLPAKRSGRAHSNFPARVVGLARCRKPLSDRTRAGCGPAVGLRAESGSLVRETLCCIPTKNPARMNFSRPFRLPGRLSSRVNSVQEPTRGFTDAFQSFAVSLFHVANSNSERFPAWENVFPKAEKEFPRIV